MKTAQIFPIFILCLLLALSTTGQNFQTDSLRAEALLIKKSYDNQECYNWSMEASQLFQKHQLEEHYYKALLTASNFKKYESAFVKQEELERLVKETKKALGLKNVESLRARIIYAQQFSNTGQPQQTIVLLDELLAEENLMELLSPKYIYHLYKSMMIAYYSIQDLQRAMDYAVKTIEQAELMEDGGLVAAALQVQALISLVRRDSKKAQEQLDRGMALMKKEGYAEYSRELLPYWDRQITIYYLGGQKDKMIELAERLIPYYKEYYGEGEHLMRHYVNIAAYYRDWRVPKDVETEKRERLSYERRKKAIEYSEKVIVLSKQLNIKNSADLAVMYRNLGTIYQHYKDPKTLETYMKSLAALLPQVDSIGNDENLDILGDDLICFDYFLAMRTTRFIARYLERKVIHKPELIESRHYWYKQWESLLFLLKKRLSDDALAAYYGQMSLYTRENLRFYKDQAVEVDKSEVFRIMELNKSIQLLQNLKSTSSAQLGGISKELLEEEAKLKKDLGDIEKALLDAAQQGNRATETKLEKEVIDLRTDYDRMLKKLEKEAPQYYKLKYEGNPYALKDIQKSLDPETVIVEYYIAGDDFHCLLIGNETLKHSAFRYRPEEEDKKWTDQLNDFREILTDLKRLKRDKEQQFKEFTEISWHFYHDILQLDKLLEGVDADHIIFIPSDVLNFIPLEVLLTEKVEGEDADYSKLPYLLKDYAISYSYSASLLLENRARLNAGNTSKILGFAASYGDSLGGSENRTGPLRSLRNGLEDLPGARAELKGIEELYKGDFYFGIAANEEKFDQSDFSQYNIIHLAMHGLVNTENPFASSLAFTENGDSLEDNFVHAYELTQMKIGAELVVLSACETGYGRFEKGNGVASLARSFMYAGVPSLVVSLWQVNDASTAIIMKDFYANLAKGDSKAKALQQAKLSFIKSVEDSNSLFAYPAFWAAFIQLGDSSPLTIKTRNDMSWLWWAIPIATFFIGGLGLIFRTRRKAA